MSYLILDKNGIEYQIAYDPMEFECDKYTNGWKIINQEPTNYQDYMKAIMYARADTAQNRLSCSYQVLGDTLRKIFIKEKEKIEKKH